MSPSPFPAPETALDHAVIAVGEWEVSNAFYRDVCGATIVRTASGGYAYRFGEHQLNCHGPGVTPTPVAELPVRPGGSDLCFAWAGTIAEAIDHLGRRAVEIVEGPVQRFGARGR